jgi:hypothetical protein
MHRIIFVIIATLLMCAVLLAQKDSRLWNEWTMKETTKMLNECPWGQTQLETRQAEEPVGAITNNGSSRTMTPRDPGKDSPGQIVSYIKYFVRFLSAKPIRQAVVRKLELENPGMDAQRVEQLRAFAGASSNDFIVVSVAAEAKDQSTGGRAQQAFLSATIESLKGGTYLERKDGQRLELSDFKQPIADGLGAKFVFSRLLNGQPFLDANSGQVRFQCQLGSKIKIEARYKVSDMIYDGKLEY